MRHIQPAFAEEFYVDPDPRIVALDFWSYINARQANLGWNERDSRLWWYLEQALAEVKPVLVDPVQEQFRPFLLALAENWRAPDVPSAPPGAVEEAQEVRCELADMLDEALGSDNAATDSGSSIPADTTYEAVSARRA